MIEFLKQPGVYEVLWFSIGLFSYKILSRLIIYGEMYRFMLKFTTDVLSLIFSLTESNHAFQRLRYEELKRSGIEPEQIKKAKKLDEHLNLALRQSLLTELVTSYPKHYKWMLEKNNWDELIDNKRRTDEDE
tara:strand:- start:169 stop:564 length:396 start_codon:yes stop_codon:yes gene_type:complete